LGAERLQKNLKNVAFSGVFYATITFILPFPKLSSPKYDNLISIDVNQNSKRRL